MSQERACPKSEPVSSIFEGMSQERACPKHFKGRVFRFLFFSRLHRLVLKGSDLKLTRDRVARCFRDGSTFEGHMRDLRTGNVGPMRNLKPLNVYHWPGRGYYRAS